MAAGPLLVLVLLSNAPAAAPSVFDEDRFGVELGGRAELGETFWTVASNGPSFGIDLRLRFGPSLAVGVSLESGSSSSPEMENSWKLHRKQVAVDVQWRFDSGPGIRPWISLGMGFGQVELEYTDGSFRSSAHAVDFARLSLGVDFLVGRFVALGPFLRGSLGHTRLQSADDVTVSPPLDSSRSLDALQVGFRALVGF